VDIRIVRQDKPSICSDTALALHNWVSIHWLAAVLFPQNPLVVQRRYIGWVGVLLPGSFRIALQLVLQVGGERWIQDRVTHERVIHTSDEHRETRRSKFKILTLPKLLVTMQKLSRQALLKSKAELTKRKEHLLMLVPKVRFRISHTPRDGIRNY